MSYRAVFITTLAIILIQPQSAKSDVTVRSDETYSHIIITGKISSKDVDTVQKETFRLGSSKIGIRIGLLASPGGSVDAAIAIGRLIRDAGFYTVVKSGSFCASACVLIFAAGVNRDVEQGGVVGIHRPSFEANYFAGLSEAQATNKYKQLAQGVKSYLTDMGMSDRLFEQMMRFGSQEIKQLSQLEMDDLNLIGVDAIYEERRRAEDTVKFGAAYVTRRDEWFERARLYGERCMSSGKTQSQCLVEYDRHDPYPQPADLPDFSRYGTPVPGQR